MAEATLLSRTEQTVGSPGVYGSSHGKEDSHGTNAIESVGSDHVCYRNMPGHCLTHFGGNVTGNHGRGFNPDGTVVTSGSQESSLSLINEPMGRLEWEVSQLKRIVLMVMSERRVFRLGPSAEGEVALLLPHPAASGKEESLLMRGGHDDGIWQTRLSR